MRALILDTFVNSVVDVDDPTYLGSRYARAIDAVVRSRFADGPSAVAYVGGGGFTLPRYYHALSGSTATVLEIDGGLPDIAVDELGLVDGPWLTVHIGDARLGIGALGESAFDAVIGDAFSGRSVPWHLTTQEFLEAVDDTLTADGLYVMNLIDHPPLRFARAEVATVASVFDHVALVAPGDYLDGAAGGNFVVAGSRSPFDEARISALVTDGEVVIVDGDVDAWVSGARVLTDDFAPADQLLSRP